MKKSLFFAAILALYSFNAGAQDKIYGGPRLAPNYSIFTEKAPEGVKSGVGYSIGYFEVLELSYKVNLQAEVNYSNYAMKNGSETTNTHAIEIPVMAKYRINENVAIGGGYLFSTGQTSGVFIDGSYKSGKYTVGARVLSAQQPDMPKSINASFYVGFGIF